MYENKFNIPAEMERNGKLYGAWLDKDGEIIPVSGYQHENIAKQILEKLCNVNDSRVENTKHGIYSIMWRLGFVRILFNSDGSHNVGYWKHAKLSKIQKEYVKSAHEGKSGNKIYTSEWSNKHFIYAS